MATLVLSAVGAVAGRWIGGALLGAAGSYLGSQVGGAIDSAIFGTKRRMVEGPRLGDLAVQSSAYGEVIPLLYGTARVAGNVIWSTGLIETRHEETQKIQGGKGGGGTRITNVSYTYRASFAVAIAARPIAGIGRIWADGKLLRDAQGRLAVDGRLRIYRGDEHQGADPLIEARQGAGQAPAYRGLAYVVFEGLALAEYVNRIPNLTFEVIADPGGTVAVKTVVADLARRAGLAAVTADAVTGTLAGYVLARSMSYRQALETLAGVYLFDAVEIDGVLVFSPLSRAPVAVVAETALVRRAQKGGSDLVVLTRNQDLDLPREVAIRHIDPARDYQVGTQRARRQTGASAAVSASDLPLVLEASAAKRVAEVELARAWQERVQANFNLPMAYAGVTAGDVIDLTVKGRTERLLIAEVDFAEGTLDCRAVGYAAEVFASVAATDPGGVPPQIIPEVAPTTLHLLNLPSVTSADTVAPVFYVAATSADPAWRGAMVFRSVDGGASFDGVAVSAVPVVSGVAITALGAGPVDFWDETNRLTVELLHPGMELESRPELAILNGGNAALLGDEIIQFRTATLDMDGRYVLSGLLRGRRGTEHRMTGHSAGERFILLDAAGLVPVEAALNAVGRADLYKGASVGETLGGVATVEFIATGENLRPFSPVHIRGERGPDGGLTLTWLRRTRVGGAWVDGADVPLGEESESYLVEIVSGGAVVRELAAALPEAIYTAAQQIEDFGAVQPAVAVRIQQRSAYVGPGTPGFAMV